MKPGSLTVALVALGALMPGAGVAQDHDPFTAIISVAGMAGGQVEHRLYYSGKTIFRQVEKEHGGGVTCPIGETRVDEASCNEAKMSDCGGVFSNDFWDKYENTGSTAWSSCTATQAAGAYCFGLETSDHYNTKEITAAIAQSTLGCVVIAEDGNCTYTSIVEEIAEVVGREPRRSITPSNGIACSIVAGRHLK